MKVNLYFRDVLQRRNRIKKFILDLFLSLASYPRLALEVFIRKNFGERYFSMASAITVAFLMAIIPSIANWIYNLFPHQYETWEDYQAAQNGAGLWSSYTTWYLFIIVFLVFSWKRMREIERSPSVFDFGKFSLYSGDIHPAFYNLRLFGKKMDVRQIETLLEPALFFAIGFALSLMGQKLGTLLIVCSIFYAIGYIAAYKSSDDFMMDKIDEMIMNEAMQDVFVEGQENHAKGVRFYMRRPNAKEDREKLADQIVYTVSDEPTYAS
ncbi:MAG TPA: hypothetical protein VD993_15390 [Chitinophagaceae bacterium]|nr:hypothetical protein [Chitinophagaceae bacterium]